MRDVRDMAAAYGVRIELADLGDWAAVTLVAEYDPDGPVIRVNERASWRILGQAQDDTDQDDDANATAAATAAAVGVGGRGGGVVVTLSLSKGAPPSRAIEHAIAHELYHHREAIGEVARIADRAARERAADAFADELVRAR
jgi:hypothetical protein